MNRSLLFAVGAALAGCGGAPATTHLPESDGAASVADFATSGSPADLAMIFDLSTAPADMALAAAYPPGPYGSAVGNVFPPLAWMGYRDDAADAVATGKAYGPYAALDLHQSGRPYGMVHIAEVF